jgi:1-acyl-sn-glycerol-3-phosphate acyltransferase
MTLKKRIVNTTIKRLTRIVCRVDSEQLQHVPEHGPLIIVANHINFIEVPLIYTHLQPRPVTGFAKAETWDNRLMGYLFDLWEAIPLKRGEPDLPALRTAIKALRDGQIIAVAPEGTRSEDGCLQRGHPGVVFLALQSQAPILPIAYHGGEQLGNNIRRLRRTDFHIEVGRPFTINTQGVQVTKQVRQHIADEIMYQLAAILPEAYRGLYSDLENASQDYLQFQPLQHSRNVDKPLAHGSSR